MKIRENLFALQDLKYKDFTAKLTPSINPDTIIGVRVPEIKALAKTLIREENIGEFLEDLPHKYYEENNLHAFIICEEKNFDNFVYHLEQFLPFVDNWATCDSMRPKVFKKYPEKALLVIEKCLQSKHTYTIRFGILMLMVYFLDENFDEKYLKIISEIKSEEYYVNMMIAWYFATALAKQYSSAIVYLEQKRLPIWVHNKTIQKAVESFRITNEDKSFLKTLKR